MNQNSKIMQKLIKLYPVVFPESNAPEGPDSSTKESVPSEFHDLIRDLLSKD
jgi:hypothetical protein